LSNIRNLEIATAHSCHTDELRTWEWHLQTVCPNINRAATTAFTASNPILFAAADVLTTANTTTHVAFDLLLLFAVRC
jgi:hypothetical protein